MPFQVNNVSPGTAAHMLLDPRDATQSTIMLLERAGNRVWTCSDPLAGAGAWTLESWGHPFWDENPYHGQSASEEGSWTCCSIPRYGVVMALASNQSGGGTMLWRPGGTLSEV